MSDLETNNDSPTSPNASGYTRLADYMAWDPPTALFHRFKSLNALNLLTLQAQISSLQEELEFNAEECEKESPGRDNCQNNWEALHKPGPINEKRKSLLTDLRATLNDYNNALIQQITLNNQPNPGRGDLKQLQWWLRNRYHGRSELRGPGADLWFAKVNDKDSREDFVSIWPRPKASDRFTMIFFERAGWWIRALHLTLRIPMQKRSFPGRVPSGMQPNTVVHDSELYSSTSGIVRSANVLATVFCCLIIIVPIIILNYINNPNFRLLVICLSTVVFSFSLASASDASRKDIFAATAAFTAVQVVFVGNG